MIVRKLQKKNGVYHPEEQYVYIYKVVYMVCIRQESLSYFVMEDNPYSLSSWGGDECELSDPAMKGDFVFLQEDNNICLIMHECLYGGKLYKDIAYAEPGAVDEFRRRLQAKGEAVDW